MKATNFTRKIFFDFYLSSYIWWGYGSGGEAYGSNPLKYFSANKVRKIDEFSEKTIALTKKILLEELQYCILSEARHIEECFSLCNDHHYVKNSSLKRNVTIKKEKHKYQVFYSDKLIKDFENITFLLGNNTLCEKLKKGSFFIDNIRCNEYSEKRILNKIFLYLNLLTSRAGKKLTKQTIEKRKNLRFHKGQKFYFDLITKLKFIFAKHEFWETDFGGNAWAKACDLWLKLYNSKTTKNDIFYIDQIFDLQHNTGFIFNKRGCKFVDKVQKDFKYTISIEQYWQKMLDIRSELKSLNEFYKYTTPNAKKLISVL